MTITSFQPVDKQSPSLLNFQVESIIQSFIRNGNLKPADLISKTWRRVEIQPGPAQEDFGASLDDERPIAYSIGKHSADHARFDVDLTHTR